MEHRFFSDGTEYYLCRNKATDDVAFVSCEENSYLIRLRIREDVEEELVELILPRENVTVEMYPVDSRNGFRIYEASCSFTEGIHFYYFRIVLKDGTEENYRKDRPFRVCPDFQAPKWSQGAVMYQIFVDRFCNGNPVNDVLDHEYFYIDEQTHTARWKELPDTSKCQQFYGGDLQGVMHKLGYLADLGVEVIYLNPIFVSPSNHKYDCMDYDHVDPHFGWILEDGGELLSPKDKNNKKASRFRTRVTSRKNLEASDAYLAELIRAAHKRGIRVILDGVFNHCGSFHKWINVEKVYGQNNGAYPNKNAQERNYFDFSKAPYECWWDNLTLPKLNYENSPELCDEIIRIARKWVSEPYCADGWRLDVAADLGHSPEFNHAFWKRFRKEVKEANPDALILAENYGDSEDWLLGDEWDTIMNYEAFMEPVGWYLTGMDKHSDSFNGKLCGNSEILAQTMEVTMSRFLTPSLFCAMNELSNHDHARFLTRTNRKIGRVSQLGVAAASEGIDSEIFKVAILMQMTWPGAPTIYYGDEAGLCGFTDPDNRRPYPWGHEDRRILGFYKQAIAVHRENEVLRTGSWMLLFARDQVVAYARFAPEEACIVTVVNQGDSRRVVQIPVSLAEAGKEGTFDVLISTENFSKEQEAFYREGVLSVEIGPRSAAILRKRG